ncbi:phosphotransferase family protein [Devosia riboflavina]
MLHPLPETVIEALDTIVKSATGSRPVDCANLRKEKDYWIVSVGTNAGDKLIVKISSSKEVPSFEEAKAKHDLIRQISGIPMAEMIAADDSQSQVLFRYSVQTRLSGEEWFTRRGRLDDGDRERALANLGDVVARLHQPLLPGFGTFAENRGQDCLAGLKDHARRIIREQNHAAWFTELLDRKADLWTGTIMPAITHDDLHGFNVLFHPDRPVEVSGILDFDKAWSGPAESDLARMELWRGMSSPYFLAAYRNRIPEMAGYDERRPFYQLLWCLEFAQSTPDHLKTTNALLSMLGLQPMGAFG